MVKFLTFVLILAIAFLSCDSDLADSPQPAYLKLSMLVDHGELELLPNDSLLVNIASIRLWRGEELRDWAIVADTNRVYNLFKFEDDEHISIANKEVMFLPPGDYYRLTIRMLLNDSTLVLAGKKYSVHMISEESQIVNIDQLISLNEGETFELDAIFSTDESLIYKLGAYTFTPNFKLSNNNLEGN